MSEPWVDRMLTTTIPHLLLSIQESHLRGNKGFLLVHPMIHRARLRSYAKIWGCGHFSFSWVCKASINLIFLPYILAYIRYCTKVLSHHLFLNLLLINQTFMLFSKMWSIVQSSSAAFLLNFTTVFVPYNFQSTLMIHSSIKRLLTSGMCQACLNRQLAKQPILNFIFSHCVSDKWLKSFVVDKNIIFAPMRWFLKRY